MIRIYKNGKEVATFCDEEDGVGVVADYVQKGRNVIQLQIDAPLTPMEKTIDSRWLFFVEYIDDEIGTFWKASLFDK